MNQQIIMGLLGVLTPEEIGELTTTSKGNFRIPLTELAEAELSGRDIQELFDIASGDAENVVDINTKDKVVISLQKNELAIGENVALELDRFFEDSEKYLSSIQETLVDEEGNINNTSTFIIKEKERFKLNQKKLKEKEVISLYKKGTTVDVEQEKKNGDDMSRSVAHGVLVNKKQL